MCNIVCNSGARFDSCSIPAAAAEEADGVIGGIGSKKGRAVLDQKITEEVVGSFTGPSGRSFPVNVIVDDASTQGAGIPRRKN